MSKNSFDETLPSSFSPAPLLVHTGRIYRGRRFFTPRQGLPMGLHRR